MSARSSESAGSSRLAGGPLKLAAAALVVFALGILAAGSAKGEPSASVSLRLQLIGRFDQPTYVTQPPQGGKVFVVERRGYVRALRGTRVQKRPYINLTRRVMSKDLSQGLLSIAFAPDFATSRRVYAYFTNKSGDQVVAEMRANAQDTGMVRGVRIVLEMNDFAPSHNGGQLKFGPDGYLYISTGDGGYSTKGDPRRTALNRNSLLGKILRIDPRKSGSLSYTSPPANPFVGVPGRDEIFSMGLRNPWRFSFDASRNLIAIGDVGQESFEEVNIASLESARGANFGWSAFEALRPYNAGQLGLANGRIAPALAYSHSNGCSVTGGVFVKDPSLTLLAGRYLYADYCAGKLRSLVYDETSGVTGARVEASLNANLVTSFGEGAAGEVWVATYAGQVFRVRQG